MALFPVPSSQSSLLQIGALFSACFSSLPLFPTIQLTELTTDHYSPRKHTLWMWRLPSPAWPSHCFLHCKSWCNGLQVSALKNAPSGPPCSLAAAGLLLLPVNALLFVLLLQSPPFALSLPNHVSQYPSPTSSAYFFSLLSLSLVLTLHAFPASVPGQEWGQSIEQGMGITVRWFIQSECWEWKTSAHNLGVCVVSDVACTSLSAFKTAWLHYRLIHITE